MRSREPIYLEHPMTCKGFFETVFEAFKNAFFSLKSSFRAPLSNNPFIQISNILAHLSKRLANIK